MLYYFKADKLKYPFFGMSKNFLLWILYLYIYYIHFLFFKKRVFIEMGLVHLYNKNEKLLIHFIAKRITFFIHTQASSSS